MKLQGKSAIITGAGSGIGKDIALVNAREGCKVAIADLNKDAADATAKEIRSAGSGQAIGIAMDVARTKTRSMPTWWLRSKHLAASTFW